MQPSRRSLLVGMPLLATAACRSAKHTTPAPPDPDVALAAAAVARELALIKAYDAAIAASPAMATRLAPLRAEHLAHLTALKAPEPAFAPSSSAVTRADLIRLERTTAAAHAAAVLTASRALAPTLASLAASETSHLGVL